MQKLFRFFASAMVVLFVAQSLAQNAPATQIVVSQPSAVAGRYAGITFRSQPSAVSNAASPDASGDFLYTTT